MDHRYLRYFIAVAEELSFTRAAERLHTVQPSLSQQIKKLEEIVSTPLFHRDTRHIELTEAGRVFLEEARAILRYTDHAIALARQAAHAEAGHIMIGFLPGAEAKIFPNVLPTLRHRCPNLQVSLRSLASPEQITALQNHLINVGFLRGPIEDSEIAWEPILRERIMAVLPAQHPLAKFERVPVPLLTEVPLVMVTREKAPVIHDRTNEIAKRAGVQFHPAIDTDNVLATLNTVGSGLGFSLLPDYVQSILPQTVVARPLALEPEPEIDLLVAYRKDDRLPALPLFLSLLHEFLPEYGGIATKSAGQKTHVSDPVNEAT
jgi:LysR family transcriptional regulator, hca operon transcriptional activator